MQGWTEKYDQYFLLTVHPLAQNFLRTKKVNSDTFILMLDAMARVYAPKDLVALLQRPNLAPLCAKCSINPKEDQQLELYILSIKDKYDMMYKTMEDTFKVGKSYIESPSGDDLLPPPSPAPAQLLRTGSAMSDLNLAKGKKNLNKN